LIEIYLQDEGFETLTVHTEQEAMKKFEQEEPDLVIMATRARSNIARWVLGSVAEKVLIEGDQPILMIKEPA